MYFELLILSYLIDMIFGEFKIKHIVSYMGDFITFFEKKFYKDSIFRGVLLTLSLLLLTYLITSSVLYLISFLPNILEFTILILIGSMTLASNMLFNAVKDIVKIDNIDEKRKKLSYLVSRDTKELSKSDVNKALIETYSENFSDGIVAPAFYLLLFGIEGAVLYKAVNTLDSMVGYKTKKYNLFGRFSAKLDDLLNYIPARLTAILIAFFMLCFNIKKIFENGKLHESLNAGFPISAIAFSIDIKLGGDTKYFNQIKSKPLFGKGKKIIESSDVLKALKLKNRLDILIFALFTIILLKELYGI